MQNIILFPYQKLAFNFAKNNKNNISFIEAPTGSGKSIIIIALAKYYAKQGKKVIISTSTNQLALEFQLILEKYINNVSFDIVLGKNNYVNLQDIDFSIFQQLNINTNKVIDVINIISQNYLNKDILIDSFLNLLDLEEEKRGVLEKILKVKAKNNNSDVKFYDFEDLDISVTNHYYLISKAIYTNFDFNNYIVLIDEVHTLEEIIENMFTNNFSLFRFKFLLSGFIEELKKIEFRGQKTLLRSLYRILKQTNNMLEIYSDVEHAGNSYINDKRFFNLINTVTQILTTDNILEVKSKLEKLDIIENKYLSALIDEWNEIVEISALKPNNIVLHFSSSKGYPSLSATKDNYYSFLKYFWEKLKEAKCFSATLTIPDDDNKYFAKKLNIKDFEFLKLSPVFSIKQLKMFMVNQDFPKPESNDESVNMEWIESIGEIIVETFENKNSMILVGSFIEAEALYNYLKNKIKTNIFKAEKSKSVYKIITSFKEKGGILIGTRNYGNGVNLKGKELENLYIAKLPYPVIGTKKWITLMKTDQINKTSYAYFLSVNEMFLNLKQWMGRLIRSKNDTGKLYILDSRARKKNIEKKIRKLIQESYIS